MSFSRLGKFVASHASFYARYFTQINEGDETRYEYNEENLKNRETKYSGFFVIVSDKTELNSKEVIDIYRDKDAVEKVFDDTKNTSDQKRLAIHNHNTLNGKFFILFLTSILVSEVRQRMINYKGKDWTFDSIRRTLDKITLSKISYSAKRKPRDLQSTISAKARIILSFLLKVKDNDVDIPSLDLGI